MSTSSYNREEQRSCRCGERLGPAAEKQLVEDLKAHSWPRLQKSSEKGHLDLLSSLWPEEWWVPHSLVSLAGDIAARGPLPHMGFAEGCAGEEPESLGYHCSPAHTATAGDDAGLSLFTDKGQRCSRVSRRC